MRILFVHNTYQHRGGEDSVVEAEIALLRSRGRAVETYFRSNDDVGSMPPLALVRHTLWSPRTTHDSGRFNLGNSSGYSVKQVIDCAHGATSRDIAVIQGERRSGDPARPVADSNKMRTVFGQPPQYSALDTSIAHAGCWESSARVGH